MILISLLQLWATFKLKKTCEQYFENFNKTLGPIIMVKNQKGYRISFETFS